MPIHTPKKVFKLTCSDCHFHLIVSRGGYGDCLTPGNSIKLLMQQKEQNCPKCGKKFPDGIKATFWERINLWESLRRFYYCFIYRSQKK